MDLYSWTVECNCFWQFCEPEIAFDLTNEIVRFNGKCKMKTPIVSIDSTLYKMMIEKYIPIQNCSTVEKPKSYI